MEHDRLFNLQLTIQKLEEELSLYRNGTTSQQLIEFISEKDLEITALNKKLTERNENLRKIHKSSTDVLQRYEALQKEYNILNEHKLSLEKKICVFESDTLKLTDEIQKLNDCKVSLEQQEYHQSKLITQKNH